MLNTRNLLKRRLEQEKKWTRRRAKISRRTQIGPRWCSRGTPLRTILLLEIDAGYVDPTSNSLSSLLYTRLAPDNSDANNSLLASFELKFTLCDEEPDLRCKRNVQACTTTNTASRTAWVSWKWCPPPARGGRGRSTTGKAQSRSAGTRLAARRSCQKP
ncbi:hypothetical protein BDW75DRAFT_206441 [Aspergillus navahoensis]